jgi:hypothetical protein
LIASSLALPPPPDLIFSCMAAETEMDKTFSEGIAEEKLWQFA